MKPDLDYQRKKMQQAIHYINVIEICDQIIAAGRCTGYFDGVKQEAVSAYADTMSNLMQNAIEGAKVETLITDPA